MKVIFKFGIGSFGGTIDEATYRPTRSKLASIMRKWVYPKLTENNAKFGAVGKNLGHLYRVANAGYREDLKVYAERYYSQLGEGQIFDIAKSGYALFMKMMYAWQDLDPQFVDLTSVTIEDIVTHESPVLTVADAVTAGLLPPVDPYLDLNTLIGARS